MKKLKDLLLSNSSIKSLEIVEVKFYSNREKDEEYFELMVNDSDVGKRVIKSDKVTWLYNWKKMLDLNLYEGEKSVYDNLSQLSSHISMINTNNDVECFVDEFLKLQSDLPFILVLVNDVYNLVKNANEKADISKPLELIDKRVNVLVDKLKTYKDYIFQALIEPYEHGKIIDPLRLLFGYEMFLSAGSEKSVLAHSVFYNAERYGSFDEKDSFLTMINEEGNILSFEMPEVYDVDGFHDEIIFDIFDDLFLSGIHYLIEVEQIPKKCKLCGRYFFNKYSYVANYCNVPYKDTKDTCQEYVSKLNYKAKTSKNPINAEYSKVYNRIYSRVRRGNLNKADAKYDELKRLRDEYLLSYELANENEKKVAIIKFQIEAERLYVTFEDQNKMLKKLQLGLDQVMLFNALAKDVTLSEFKRAVDFQCDLGFDNEIDESQQRYIIENLKRISESVDEKLWFEIQCLLPFTENI